MGNLIELDAGVWHVEQHHHAGPIHVRVRMVVVQLASGGLWLHSPVEMTDELVAELAALGPVEHIVAPSHGHTKWVPAATTRFPNATLWGAPGLRAKKPALSIDRDLGEEGLVSPWSDAIETCILLGNPTNNEVVFVHRRARTLICTDLVINVDVEPSIVTRGLYMLIGVWKRLATPRPWRSRTKDRQAARASFEHLLALDFDRVVMAHGEPVCEDGKARLRAALDWV